MAPSTLKHELGGGEYWENEALRAKIDGFGTRYNDDEKLAAVICRFENNGVAEGKTCRAFHPQNTHLQRAFSSLSSSCTTFRCGGGGVVHVSRPRFARPRAACSLACEQIDKINSLSRLTALAVVDTLSFCAHSHSRVNAHLTVELDQETRQHHV